MAEPADRAGGDGALDVAAWLASGEALGAEPVRRIDTHAASVFLAGDTAWKIKRPVRFAYLDFSTPDRRHAALAEELRLNRRTAPRMYRDLHPITRDQAGRLAIDGEGATVDWVLEMRRFPDGARWTELADRGGLDEPALRQLTDGIVRFHALARVAPTDQGAERIRRVVLANADSMAAVSDSLAPREAAALSARLLALVEQHRALLDARARAGRVRHVHGDLHLANIATIDGVPTPFDCLEFDAELATTDVLYDIAFLLMDLWDRGQRRAANIVFNRYLDLSPADEAGIALLPLFMSLRAAIRAHVLAASARREGAAPGADERARGYLRLARALLLDTQPRLIAIGGLSGTGKSTLARALGPSLGRPPGARILRSDVLRKRLAGLAPETRLPPAHYTAEANRRAYEALARSAGEALQAGQAVVADAVFRAAAERQAIEAVARDAGCPFAGVWLDLPARDRATRVERRTQDASDADARVALAQTEPCPGSLGSWTRLDSGGAIDALAHKARASLGLPDMGAG